MSAARIASIVVVQLISVGAFGGVASLDSGNDNSLKGLRESPAPRPASLGDHAVVVGRSDRGGRGQSLAVATSGSIAWIGVGRNLKAVDISDPANPRLVKRLELGAGDDIVNLSVAGHRAYVLTALGLRVVDVSRPAHPRVIGSLALRGGTWMTQSGGRLYVADRFGFVSIVDVSSPTAPTLVGSIYVAARISGLASSGDNVFLAAYPRLLVFDVSDPAAPIQVGSENIVTGGLGPIAVAGTSAYLATLEALLVFDVSDAASPRLMGSLPWSPLNSDFDDIAVEGRYLYYTDYGYDSGRLSIVDVASPASPHAVSIYSVPGVPRAVAPSGNRVFLALQDTGLHIVDVSIPDAPAFAGALVTPPGLDSSVVVADTHAFLIDPDTSRFSSSAGSLRVIDVSRPAAPREAAFMRLPGGYSSAESAQIAVLDSRAYIAGGGASLRMFDVSNPEAPAELGPYVQRFWQLISSIMLSDSKAYGVASRDSILQAFDISDPTAPFSMGNVYFPGSSRRGAVAIAGGYAYTAHGYGILDVSNSYDMHWVGAGFDGGYSVATDPAGGPLYSSTSAQIRVMDLTDPVAPVTVGACDLPVPGGVDLVASGSLLAGFGGSAGVVLVDTSNREAPAIIGSYPVPSANDVAIQGDYIYVAAGYEGLYVLALDADNDGVGNPTDVCPTSDMAPEVVIGTCDPGVPNVVSRSGCTVLDRIASCMRLAHNHEQYIGCVARIANQLEHDGLIGDEQRWRLVRCARQRR